MYYQNIQIYRLSLSITLINQEIFKLASMTTPVQVRVSLLIYRIIVYKVNNDNKDTTLNVDQHNNHLPFIDDPDLCRLIH